METSRLKLCNWRDKDFSAYYRLNNDAKVMEFFPWRLSEQQAFEKFTTLLQADVSLCFGIKALQQKSTGKIVGMSGLVSANIPDFFPNSAIEIIWRILPEYQRQGFAFEAAQYIIKHGFQHLAIDEIIAFTAAVNLPSINLMQKLGMQKLLEKSFIHLKVPDSHPHLKQHRTFVINNRHYL